MADTTPASGRRVRSVDAARSPSSPTFTEFYRAINGRDPFPWQARLADYVAGNERWPPVIGIPTGLGKTACLDIAVWWLSHQADRVPTLRSAPTRIWWVVNQHLFVDSTAEHARDMARALHDPVVTGLDAAGRDVAGRVAERLRSLWVDPAAPPLDVISLRGGIASPTPTDPARPTVILCTLASYGSRLLFRGDGSSRPSVDAAMAGTDSLVLLDEAHPGVHLRTLIPALAACSPAERDLLGANRSRPTVVTLTATGDVAQGDRFELDSEDETHPEVRRRLDAAKPLTVSVDDGKTAKRLAKAAEALVQRAPAPAACLVFANTPTTARETFERLRHALPDAEILLLTGLAREPEAARIRARVLDPEHGMATVRPADALRRRHLIVVATQTLEAGADIDAEYLVTEGGSVRALTQRLGRLNRLGRFPHARATYVHVLPSGSRRGNAPDTDFDDWPVYGRESAIVFERLQKSHAGGGARTVELSPRSIASVLGPPLDHPGRAPEVLPGLLWEWTKTTKPPEDEAPVEPYFVGVAGARRSVTVFWRSHVPASGRRLWPRATDGETIEVSFIGAREALSESVIRRLVSDGITVEAVSAGDLRPGDRIVIASDAGHMDRFGWHPGASGPVADVSLAGLGLPLDAVAIRRLCGVDTGGLVDIALGIIADDREVDEAERSEAISDILAAIRKAPVPEGWQEAEWARFVGILRPQVLRPRDEVPRLVVEQPHDETLNDEFDERSLCHVAIELDRHGQAVGTRARRVAEGIGLPDGLRDVVERAGKLHDIGKSDARYQRWLDPRRENGPPLAKSDVLRHRWERMRLSSGWPIGGRHEELSARLVRAWLALTPEWGSRFQRDLLVHLVVSHHAKGRPLVPPATDGTAGTVSAVVSGVAVTASADLAMIDWEQPGRFRKLQAQLGPWGLSLLEAIVIGADQAVSAELDGTPEEF